MVGGIGFKNGWSNRGNGPQTAYQLLASPPGQVEIIGDLTGGTLTGQHVDLHPSAGYRSAVAQIGEMIVVGRRQGPWSSRAPGAGYSPSAGQN